MVLGWDNPALTPWHNQFFVLDQQSVGQQPDKLSPNTAMNHSCRGCSDLVAMTSTVQPTVWLKLVYVMSRNILATRSGPPPDCNCCLLAESIWPCALLPSWVPLQLTKHGEVPSLNIWMYHDFLFLAHPESARPTLIIFTLHNLYNRSHWAT